MITWVLNKLIGSHNERALRRLKLVVEQINALEPQMQALQDSELKTKGRELKERLQQRIKELGEGLTPEGKVPLSPEEGGEGAGGADEDAVKAERKRRLRIKERALRT